MSEARAIDNLILSYFAGDMEPDEMGELDRRIAGEPDVRERFVELTRQEMILRQIVLGKALATQETPERATAAGGSRIFRFLVPLAAAAVLAVAAGIYLLVPGIRTRPLATVVSARGAPGISIGAGFGNNESISVPAGGRAKVLLSDNTTIELNEKTRLTFLPQDCDEALHLTSGEIYCISVKKASGEKPFAIRALEGHRAVALGTEFEMGIAGATSYVSVAEGVVRMEAGGSSGLAGVKQALGAVGSQLSTLTPVAYEEIAPWRVEGGRILARWTFEKGVPDGLVIVEQAGWEVQAEKGEKPAVLAVSAWKATIHAMPKAFVFPEEPIEVLIEGSAGAGGQQAQLTARRWANGELPACRYWQASTPAFAPLSEQRVRCVFADKYLVWFQGGSLLGLCEYLEASRSDRLLFSFRNCNVTRLRIRLLTAEDAGKLPEWIKAGRALGQRTDEAPIKVPLDLTR